MIVIDITVTKVMPCDHATKYYKLACDSMFQANKIIERISAGRNTVAAFIDNEEPIQEIEND